MKRRFAWFLIALLLANVFASVSFATGEHPISLSILADPNCELETEGTVPFLTFTIRNHSDASYTLKNATLSLGYESKTYSLDSAITVEAGGTKEFTLNEVFIREDQFDAPVTYRLSWTETSIVTDAFGIPSEETAQRMTEASVTVTRFVPPTLQLSAVCDAEMVRMGESFIVRYHIVNETKYDMSSLVLTDPTATDTVLSLPKDTLVAGETMVVACEYQMGETDMVFTPKITYVARQRQMETVASSSLSVASCITSVRIDVQQYPTTKEGTTFALTITNDGNRTLTDIQLYDEIQTPIDSTFDLAPQQQKVLMYSIAAAEDLDAVRTVRFHGTAVDAFMETITFTDDEMYQCLPYISSEDVRLSLSVVLTDAYYDAEGNLCGKIQFTLSNYSEVTILNATLTETTMLGTVAHYQELMRGDTYYTGVYKLNGVPSLSFLLEAYDQAEQRYASEVISLDLSSLAALANRTEEDTVIYHSNTYLDDLLDRFTGLLKVTGIVLGIIVLVCAIVILVLYLMEHRLKAELPKKPSWTMHVHQAQDASNRTLFDQNATEQFGVTVPAKLRQAMQEEMPAAKPPIIASAKNESSGIATGVVPTVSEWKATEVEQETRRMTTALPQEGTATVTDETIRIPIVSKPEPMEREETVVLQTEQTRPIPVIQTETKQTAETEPTEGKAEQASFTDEPQSVGEPAMSAEVVPFSQTEQPKRTEPKTVETQKPPARRSAPKPNSIHHIS